MPDTWQAPRVEWGPAGGQARGAQKRRAGSARGTNPMRDRGEGWRRAARGAPHLVPVDRHQHVADVHPRAGGIRARQEPCNLRTKARCLGAARGLGGGGVRSWAAWQRVAPWPSCECTVGTRVGATVGRGGVYSRDTGRGNSREGGVYSRDTGRGNSREGRGAP